MRDILANVNMLTVTMFVDSGGSVSILRKDIFDTIPPSSRPIIKFLLAEIKDTAILGMNFFMKHKIDLLFSKGCIKVREDFIPCFTNKGDPKCCRISVAETVEIPPE